MSERSTGCCGRGISSFAGTALLRLCLSSARRFAQGRGPGLPTADLARAAQIILTGGAAQVLVEDVVARVVRSLLSDGGTKPVVLIDRRYQVWIDGITWSGMHRFPRRQHLRYELA